jgi:hypothetical protein
MCGSLAYNGYSVRPARSSDYTAFVQWRMLMDDTLGTLESYEKVNSFWTSHNVVSIGRRFFITEQGYIGWGPTGITKGDYVAILSGGRVPYVLRRVSGKPETNPSTTKNRSNMRACVTFSFWATPMFKVL